jgi:hypothetical protein
MPIKRCSNEKCFRPFQLNSYSLKAEVVWETGIITCPNCGHIMKGNDQFVFLTHALSKTQEARFHADGSVASFGRKELSLNRLRRVWKLDIRYYYRLSHEILQEMKSLSGFLKTAMKVRCVLFFCSA